MPTRWPAARPASIAFSRAQDSWPGSRLRPAKKAPASCSLLQPHEHWHVDISYLNIAGTFYFLCAILDGCSRFIVHWEIREKMEEIDVETIVQRAREAYPGVTPRIITDNGPLLTGDSLDDARKWTDRATA